MSNTLEFDWVSQNEHYRTGHGTVRAPEGVIDFVIKRPHELQDTHPVTVAPGFTDGTVGPDRLTNYFAEERRVGVTLTHPRTEHPHHKGDPEGHKADNLRLVVEALHDKKVCPDLDKADLAGHSEGGANSSRLALEHPELVRSLTIMGSGGLIEDDNMAKIIRRATRSIRGVAQFAGHFVSHLPHDARLVGSSISYLAKNPRKAIEEAAHISTADIRHRFQLLREAGIPSAALQFGGDVLFPLHLVDQSTNNGSIFDQYTVYPHDSKAGHLTPQYHPRRVGKIVLDGIDLMTAASVYNKEYA